MSSHLLRSVKTLLSHSLIWRSVCRPSFLGDVPGRNQREEFLHGLLAGYPSHIVSQLYPRARRARQEGFVLSETRGKPSLTRQDAPWAGIPGLESTKHPSKAGDAAVWPHYTTRDHGHRDSTVPQRVFFRRGWATQSLHGVGEKPLRNKSTWQTLWNLLNTLLLPIYSTWMVFRCNKQLGNILK